MFKHVSLSLLNEYLSAFTVVIVGALLGARAAEGMSLEQWVGGISAMTGAIAWAVMVRAWPVKARA
jgi:hypothetical protein